MILSKTPYRIVALLAFLVLALPLFADTNPLYRYVKATGGTYAGDGKTWATAKNNVQDAINDLHDYMVKAGITQGGKVFVAAGTYKPTETTETTGGSQLGLSIKIYSGITVEGGYPADATDGATRNITTNKTIFSGNISTQEASFTWNTTKQQYVTQFPGNVYHVVWFATNGFKNDGRANALPYEACLDGVIIEGGRAYNKDLVSAHPHNAYGAGVYAVGNAVIRNCEIRLCEASRDGGGIYLDGGGEVTHCHIHQCQALGLGIKHGRGGAICVDGGGIVSRVLMTNNVAREGGALAIYNKGTCLASLLTNNTATTEAGGAYLKDGGVLSGVSVMRNRCNGSGAVIDGITTGKSGGVFAVGPARIYNSALWGNQVGDNGNPATYDASPLSDTYDDLQFSAYKSEGQEGSALYYVAMNNNDRVNWSHTSTRGMVSLATKNAPAGGDAASLNYINLVTPSTKTGVITDYTYNLSKDYHTTWSFQPKFISALVNKGIQLDDMPAEDKVGAEDAAMTKDIANRNLSPLCDLGAYLAEAQNIIFADDIANQENKSGTTKTLFVDPNRSTSISGLQVGNSWSTPLANLRDALGFIREYKNDTDHPEQASYKYQILCKEGILYTSGTATSEPLAQSSIYMIDGVAVYGGFPSSLTDVLLENGNIKRDPVTYPTTISGSIISGDYERNAAHLINFANVSNAILDGFQLRYGNASGAMNNPTLDRPTDTGAGIILTNMFEYNASTGGLGMAQTPIAMTGNIVRNTVITGCTARSGAAIYTHIVGSNPSTLSLNNCIIHNNSVIYGNGESVIPSFGTADRSIIHVAEHMTLNIDHCDVLRNVGYGIIASNGSAVNVKNSMFYANLDRKVDNTNEFDVKPSATNPKAKLCAPIRKESNAAISGSNNLFDYLFAQDAFGDDYVDHSAARFSEHYISDINIEGTRNICNLTYSLVNNDNYTYPKFKNPTRNSGVSPDGDVTFYGNETSFMPLSMNPMVNAAVDASLTKDMTTVITRDFGGASDLGAVENYEDLPRNAASSLSDDSGFKYYQRNAYFVKDYRNADGTVDYLSGGDGSSWTNAINGNAMYNLSTGQIADVNNLSNVTEVDYIVDAYEYNSLPDDNNPSTKLYKIKNVNANRYVNISRGATTNVSNAATFAFVKADGAKLSYVDGQAYNKYYIKMYKTVETQAVQELHNVDGVDYYVYTDGCNDTKYYHKEEKYYTVAGNTETTLTNPVPVYTTPYSKKLQSLGYLHLTASSQGADKFGFESSMASASQFIFVGTPDNFDVIPVEAINSNATADNQLSWNWYGGANESNAMGLFKASDSNSAWQFVNETANGTFTFMGYRLKAVNGSHASKYISTTEKTKVVSGYTTHTLKSTTEASQAEVVLIGTLYKSGTYQSIIATKTSYQDKGFHYVDMSGGTRLFTLSSNANPNWDVELQTSGEHKGQYLIYFNNKWAAGRPQTYFSIDGDGDLCTVRGTANKSQAVYWIFEPVYTRVDGTTYENGLQYAINSANKTFTALSAKREVWVAAGTYTGNYMMKQGADVLGGFPAIGNPGKQERNISNMVEGYKTILDGNGAGRVLQQDSETAYTTETTWEGLTLRNGNTVTTECGAGAYLTGKSRLKNCLVTENTYTASSGWNYGGAGVYMKNGSVVENSIIKANVLNCNGQTTSAGAYLSGAGNKFINSLVVENVVNATSNILGAGLYAGAKGDFYNCTFAYNVADNKGVTATVGGVWDNSKTSQFYNCIFWGNVGKGNTAENFYQVGMSGFAQGAGKSNTNFHNCYHAAAYANAASDKADEVDLVYITNTGTSPTTDNINFVNKCREVTPFIEELIDGVYISDYRLKQPVSGSLSSHCINKGSSEDVLASNKIFEDITGAERIQDCTVDKGAYEYDGAAEILPTVTVIKDAGDNVIGTTATYYVTEAGTGTASALNASNAACSQKLQKVLDAAGRYKYAHPTHKVKVLLAGNNEGDGAKYVPRRTADQVDVENARSWSLMVPHGVEVFGGFAGDFEETNRNSLTYKTILDGKYTRSQDESESTAYHVVTFTDRIFDAQGLPYLKEDVVFNGSAVASSHYDTSNEDYTDADMLLLSTSINKAYENNPIAGAMQKAILDGLFIQNGKADGVAAAGSSEFNPHCYGGGAIVPGFANVRNCILQNNEASVGGGALYLQPGAIVSGSLIKKNKAKLGGGIYFENDEEIDNSQYMAQLLTSTIVDNKATEKGGGIWFNWNAKINSTVIWGNSCGDQANVSGQTGAFPFIDAAKSKPFDMYPFAYSAVENNKYPGPNNMSVASENLKGVRFASNPEGTAIASEKANINEFYPLTDYSVLCKNGTSLESFIQNRSYGIMADNDFAGVDRSAITGYDYMDIGARAYNANKVLPSTADDILLRLFVAQPEDVNMTACQAVKGCGDPTYSKRGSSFAYPMQSLDEALEYIIDVRKDATLGETAKNLQFEIVMAGGTYYPTRDPYDRQGICYSNTFLVPEGVTIVGGLNIGWADNARYFYGQIKKASGDLTVGTPQLGTTGYYMEQELLSTIKSRRKHTDNNANDIIEPWEFQFQTILSGQIINSNADDRIYHVVTAVADENLVGKLPSTPQNVELNGIQISGGQAYEYYKDALDQGFLNYGYFVGGGVYVDGNWQGTLGNAPTYKRRTTPHATGYRDIPLVIDRCQFLGNEAGCGGAIATTSTLSVYNSSFENNLAWGGADTDVPVGDGEALPVFNNNVPARTMSVNYPGFGGAIYGTSTITCLNTVFANNEATFGDITTGERPISFTEPSEPTNPMLFIPGQGGAVYAGANAQVQATNCDFVRNKAVSFPAIFLTAPNQYQMGAPGNKTSVPSNGNYNKVFNSVFWGNEGTASDSRLSFAKNLVVNFAKHSVARTMPTNETNVYAQYAQNQTSLDMDFAQGMWFCAYEKGTGQTPVNTLDVRKASIDLTSEAYVGDALMEHAKKATADGGLGLTESDYIAKGYQDANVIISSDNAAIDGPNFTNPSHLAGNEGYMQDADWMPLRINLLTDGGWGYVKQEVGTPTDSEDKTGVVFTADDTDTNGIFSALQVLNNTRVAVKDENYMQSLDKKLIRRISKVPAPFHDPYDYVDIGVYEYQYQKLVQGEHVDYLWITETEDLSAGVADGSTWQKATSDVQRAIETLLASRCGHDKYLFVKEGKYKPLTKYDGNLGYTINTGELNGQATTIGQRGVDMSVPSLTIVGGYSSEVATTINNSNFYDNISTILKASNPETFPTTFYAEDDATNTLFKIVDARQWYGMGTEIQGAAGEGSLSGSTLKGKNDVVSVIPITIDGLRFYNPHGTTGGVAINYSDMGGVTSGSFAGEPAIKMDRSRQNFDTQPIGDVTSEHFPKLTLRRCIFHANGKADATGDVVKIGQGGGFALIANSLFDNNNTTGYTLNTHDAKIVNCTFANNKAGINMTGDTKTIDNSIMWKNGSTEVTGTPTITNSAYTGYTSGGTGNSALSNDNNDLATGPNFADPANGDYHLRPSLTILNKVTVSDPVYKAITGVAPDSDTDLAGNPRLHSTNLDLGAYEYQQALQRIIFYDPNKVTAGDGTDWQNAYSYGNFQNAIDMAAVYHGGNTSTTAYVFAKGGKDGRKTDEAITLRAGVEVMGSINPSETVSSITKGDPATTLEMKNATDQTDINTYIQTVIANKRPGLLCPSTSRTIIDGLTTQGTYTAQTSIDNIYVEGNLNVAATATPSDATANVLLRNMVVTGGTASLQGAIAYNTLFFNNISSPSVATNAYAIHCTSEKAFAGPTANALYCNTSAFAMQSWNEYPALNYQLPYDDATCIDKGEASFAVVDGKGVKAHLPSAVSSLTVIENINFAYDRDLLGNNRLIDGKADNGAFEAWVVKDDVTARSNDGSNPVNEYPHEGTNVTIQPGANLILDGSLTTSNIGFLPGYLHLMQGGSLYSNGNNVNLANVAVSRDIKATGSVVSMPFPHTYTDGTVYRYNGEKRSKYDYDFSNSDSPCWEEYDGEVPANEGVLFVPDTHRWYGATHLEMVFHARGITPQNYVYTEGAQETFKTVTLLQHKEVEATGNAHFTTKEDMGWNCIGIPYLVSNYKPYEKVNTTNGSVLALGDSGYDAAPYRMNIPHTLWLYYNGTGSPDGTAVNGDGGFYSVNSWEDTTVKWHVNTPAEASLWTGEGFFTQTATLSDSEALVFYRPAAPNTPVTSKPMGGTRFYVGGIEDQEPGNPSGAELLRTEYYTLGGLRIAAPQRGSVTIRVDVYSDGTVRTCKTY